MAKKASKWTGMIGVVTVVLLLAFGVHLWTFDYKIAPADDDRSARLARGLFAKLRIETGKEYGSSAPMAVLTLMNNGKERIRLVNTAAQDPLYELRLQYGQDGQWQDVRESSPMRIRRSGGGFNKDTDALVELVPGTAFTRMFALPFLFDMRRKGKYQLTIKYTPSALRAQIGSSFAYLDVIESDISTVVQFDHPAPVAPEPGAPEPNVKR